MAFSFLFILLLATLAFILPFHLHSVVLVRVVTMHLHQLHHYTTEMDGTQGVDGEVSHIKIHDEVTRLLVILKNTSVVMLASRLRWYTTAVGRRLAQKRRLTVEFGLLERLDLANVDVLHGEDALHCLEYLSGDVLGDAATSSNEVGITRLSGKSPHSPLIQCISTIWMSEAICTVQ